jgi:hypothetical protein
VFTSTGLNTAVISLTDGYTTVFATINKF